jgi:FkbM family methyltransferase
MRDLIASLARRLQLSRSNPGPGAASYLEVERAERQFYVEYLSEGMMVFDVGANVGQLTELFSNLVGHSERAGCVHAFEAGREAFSRLANLCQTAGLRNVVLNHLALADQKGSINLNVYDEDHLAWSTQALRPLQNYGINTRPVSVEETRASTVDLYCEENDIAKIDLLKIDVEGAEFQVLKGARQMLESLRIACVAFEFGQTTFDMGNEPDQIESYLTGIGYRVRNLVAGDPVFPGRSSVQTAQFSMHIATPGGS